jgi:hypothetical protein
MKIEGIDVGQVGDFRKASSSESVDKCVSVAVTSTGHRVVRHSTRVGGAAIPFDKGEWAAFLDGVRAGEFDIED